MNLVALICLAVGGAAAGLESWDGNNGMYHLLPPDDGYDDPRRGVLLLEYQSDGDGGALYTACDCLDEPKGALLYEKICGNDLYILDHAEKYFNRSLLEEFEQMSAILNNKWDRYQEKCPHTIFIECAAIAEVTFTVLSMNDSTLVQGGDHGLVVAVIDPDYPTDPNKKLAGTVCSDHVGRTEADKICQSMGFDRSHKIAENGDFQYVPSTHIAQLDLDVVMSGLSCPADADLEDCHFRPQTRHNCTHHENLVVFCGDSYDCEQVYPTRWFLLTGNGTEVRLEDVATAGSGVLLGGEEGEDQLYTIAKADVDIYPDYRAICGGNFSLDIAEYHISESIIDQFQTIFYYADKAYTCEGEKFSRHVYLVCHGNEDESNVFELEFEGLKAEMNVNKFKRQWTF